MSLVVLHDCAEVCVGVADVNGRGITACDAAYRGSGVPNEVVRMRSDFPKGLVSSRWSR